MARPSIRSLGKPWSISPEDEPLRAGRTGPEAESGQIAIAEDLVLSTGRQSIHDPLRKGEMLPLRAPSEALNASRWPEAAHARYREERRRLGRDRHFQAKEEVARQFGHGVLDADLMREAPGFGAALVGVGTVRKDTAQVFDVPLPPTKSGDSVPRAMYVTLAWFSPMEPSRARYRLAALERVERADLRRLRPVPQENFLLRKKRISDLHPFQSILPCNL